MHDAAMFAALEVPRGVALSAGAIAGGYMVGALPLATLALAARRRRALSTARGVPLRVPGRRRPMLELMAEGGIRVAVMVLGLELLKGGVVGLGARLYDDTSWFAATAIAGCVLGDAFPPGRTGRRGVVPLVSGVLAALPGTWAAGAFIAVPVLVVLLVGGLAYEGAIAVCVPLALVLGSHDLRSLVPAAVIVGTLVARNRLRRRAQARATAEWRSVHGRDAPLVVEAPRHP